MFELRSHIENLRQILYEQGALSRGEGGLDFGDQETLELLALNVAALLSERGGALDVLVLRDVIRLLRQLDPRQHRWADDIAKALVSHLQSDVRDEDAALLHTLEIGRRLLATHLFLRGESGEVDYRTVKASGDGDIRVGLGLGLKDGGLPKLLVRLTRQGGGRPASVSLKPFFDEEAEALARLLQDSPAQVSDYLRAQVVFRHDVGARGLVGSLPEAWQLRLGRLGVELNARRLQLELACGARLMAARQIAAEHGLQSLRGLALAYEAQPLLSMHAQTPTPEPQHGPERERIERLAEQVLSRVQGGMYLHWSARIQSLIEGQGVVAGRPYREDGLLGPKADAQPWRYDPASGGVQEGELEAASDEPEPGNDYLVRAGDHLSTLARRAYQGKGGFEHILRANPQLRSPNSLVAGQRLHIPALAKQAPKRAHTTKGIEPWEEGGFVMLPGRSVGPLRQAQCRHLLDLLAQHPQAALRRVQAHTRVDGYLVTLDGQVLITLDDEDVEVAQQRHEDAEDPLAAWARRLAAELRGDIILEPDHYLPLAVREAEPQRRQWLQGWLRQVRDEGRLASLILALDRRGERLQIAAEDGDVLASLDGDDIDTICQRPGRRLRDLVLPGRALMEQAALLWISDLRGEGVELLVPPLQEVRRYNVRQQEGAQIFLVPVGTPVFAMASGVVRHAGPAGGVGLGVLIDHGHGLFTRYGHLGSLNVRPGQDLDAEQMLGRSGMTGEVVEPCLVCQVEARGGIAHTWRVQGARVLDFGEAVGSPTRAWKDVLVTQVDGT